MNSSLKSEYLLPGERDLSSSNTIHTHGAYRNISSTKSIFISIPRIYIPKEKDFIIGIVIVRTPDLFLVDINSTESAILPIPSFDSGRLPARNAMNRLSVVCAHVVRTDRWTQTELSCQSLDNSKKKAEFGLITQGNIVRCSLGLCEKLHQSNLINRLHAIIKNFHIRIARNGFIWYQTDTINEMIAVKNILYEHELENNIHKLINSYQELINKLQQQDDSLVKVKQQNVKKDVEVKKIEQPIVNNNNNNNNAVTRLLNQVIRNVLDKIIDDIENNENN